MEVSKSVSKQASKWVKGCHEPRLARGTIPPQPGPLKRNTKARWTEMTRSPVIYLLDLLLTSLEVPAPLFFFLLRLQVFLSGT